MAKNKRKNRRLKPQAGTAAGGQQVFYILAGLLAAITGFAVVAIILSVTNQQPGGEVAQQQTGTPAEPGKGGMSKLIRVSPPRPLGTVAFEDAEGHSHSLGEWKGKVVLVNLWATWCAPCKEEMPSLSRLQSKLGGPDFAVVAVSLDRGGIERPAKFLKDTAPSLQLYLDKTGRLMQALRAPGLPVSVLVDREGREIARLAGAAPWDGPDAESVIRAAMSGKNGA